MLNVTDSLTHLLEIMFSKGIPKGMKTADLKDKMDSVYFTSCFGNMFYFDYCTKTIPEAEQFLKKVFEKHNSPDCCRNKPCMKERCKQCLDLYRLHLYKSKQLKECRSKIYYHGLVGDFFSSILIPLL